METTSSLYSKLVELLGSPRNKQVDLLIAIAAKLNEQPVIEYCSEKYWEYQFEKSGIDLSYDNVQGWFNHLCLHIATPVVKEGLRNPYVGDLPFGIDRSDPKEDVELKLPGATMAIKDYRTDRDLRPFVVTAHFQAPDFNAPGIGMQWLVMWSVKFAHPSLDPPERGF